jgi:hypothetical protein
MRWNTESPPTPAIPPELAEQAKAEAERQAQQPSAVEAATDVVATGIDLLDIASTVVEGTLNVVGEVLGGILDL